MDISKSLKLALIKNDITSRELARHINVSEQWLSRIRTGHEQASMKLVLKLADYFDLSVSEFIALGEKDTL